MSLSHEDIKDIRSLIREELSTAQSKDFKQTEMKEAATFKVGDWVALIEPLVYGYSDLRPGCAYQVTEVRDRGKTLKLDIDSSWLGWFADQFRPATQQEIAVVTEIKVGDWVTPVIPHPYDLLDLEEGALYKVTTLCECNNQLGCTLDANSVEMWYLTRFRKATSYEIKAHLEKVAAEKAEAEKRANEVIITVEGHDYTVEYNDGYVRFGCAQISNTLIRAAHKLITQIPASGNRTVTSITIGKGIFDKNALAKLVVNLK